MEQRCNVTATSKSCYMTACLDDYVAVTFRVVESSCKNAFISNVLELIGAPGCLSTASLDTASSSGSAAFAWRPHVWLLGTILAAGVRRHDWCGTISSGALDLDVK